MTDKDRPLYQISGSAIRGYEVTRFTGRDHPTMTYYDEPCELSEEIAYTVTFEGAIAVLRLLDVQWFSDWRHDGNRRPHWGQPLTEVA